MTAYVYLYPEAEALRLDMGIWYYGNQRQGHGLVQDGSQLVDGSEWGVLRRERGNGALQGWSIMELSHRCLDQHRLLVVSHFMAGAWVSSGGLAIKAEMLRQAFSGRRDGALVVLSIRCQAGQCERAEMDLTAVVRNSLSQELSAKIFDVQ